MAEFRKLFYALGLASLLVGASSTAKAAVVCSANVANPPIIREESFTELLGDIVLDCTGGTPTAGGIAVQTVNFTLSVSAPVTSRLLSNTDSVAGLFNEALLIVDEPNTGVTLGGEPAHTARQLLACGDNDVTGGAPNFSAPYDAGFPGICTIIAPTTAPGSPSLTYDGTQGRPNVFQGRYNPSNSFQIRWNGVPFDPPGMIADGGTEPRHRIFRFTNIRVWSPSAASPGQLLSSVSVEININGQDITLSNRTLTAASVSKGIDPQSGLQEINNFLQCQNVDADLNAVIYREGFPSSFKARGWGEIERNGEQANAGAPWLVDVTGNIGAGYVGGGAATYGYSNPQLRQNVPGGLYFTESGFNSKGGTGWTDPLPNSPVGTGTTQGLTGGLPIFNTTGIEDAGIATNGTRIILSFRDIPAGTTLSAPNYVYLYRAGQSDTASRTGVAIKLTSTASARGDGPLQTPPSTSTALSFASVSPSNRVVYEVLFSRSQIIEDMRIVLHLTSSPNLASDQPEVNKSALVTGGFAPFQLAGDNFGVPAFGSVTVGSSGLPIPRFVTQTGEQKLYSYVKCSCNLLFPFTTNASTSNGNFDTGIAIANTSKLPSGFGFNPISGAGTVSDTSQQGGVQFWYFAAGPNAASTPATQCANKTNPPSAINSGCDPQRTQVKAGETLTYILSQNDIGANAKWGLDNRARGFTGYIVAQTGFQYCHAFAYISPEGAFPLTNGMSVGYLALVLDKYRNSGDLDQLQRRTSSAGENLVH